MDIQTLMNVRKEIAVMQTHKYGLTEYQRGLQHAQNKVSMLITKEKSNRRYKGITTTEKEIK